ncbi:hypothetical protein NPIL_548491 [Nephila pilipes]|uniref:Uncharacterized protein n=1 Tax=Nephila pilipes TaxID=299642 RepID=A0A8X6MRJ0_NEPPI|nr:hypothetical protein NPIL_548491 [Nephila pilipes]
MTELKLDLPNSDDKNAVDVRNILPHPKRNCSVWITKHISRGTASQRSSELMLHRYVHFLILPQQFPTSFVIPIPGILASPLESMTPQPNVLTLFHHQWFLHLSEKKFDRRNRFCKTKSHCRRQRGEI